MYIQYFIFLFILYSLIWMEKKKHTEMQCIYGKRHKSQFNGDQILAPFYCSEVILIQTFLSILNPWL